MNFKSHPFTVDRRIWLLMLSGGLLVFFAMSTIIILSYLSNLRERKEEMLNRELPLLMQSVEQQLLSYFDTTTPGLRVLAARDDWPRLLDDCSRDIETYHRMAEQWADLLEVASVSLLDISREVVYAYWSDDPIQMDPNLERDKWFYDTWAVETPPESCITFYYDDIVGGHAFYLDRLIQSPDGAPIGVVGALLTLEPLADRLRSRMLADGVVYLIDGNGSLVLEVSDSSVFHFVPVYDRSGYKAPNAKDGRFETSVPLRYLRGPAAPDDGVALTPDQRFAVATVNLPIEGMTARVFLAAEQRFAPVRRTAMRHVISLVGVFGILFGGFAVTVAFYTARNGRQMRIIQADHTQLDDLLSILTHNLSNDLHSLRRSVLELAKTPAGPGGFRPQSRNEHAAYVADKTLLDMEQVLQNAIYSARMASSPLSVVRSSVTGESLLNRLYTSCRHVAEAKSQVLVMTNETSSPISTDEDVLFHVLLNLLGNAIKFSPKGSAVLIAALEQSGGIDVVVADQGPGFSEADRKQLFQKNRRLSARPTDGERSTGLGLYVTRNLVDRIGAQLVLLPSLPEKLVGGPFSPHTVGAVWAVHVSKENG